MSSEQLKAFVFTDIVASTRLKQEMPGLGSGEKNSAFVADILRPHRERIEATLAGSNGSLVNTQGDGCFLVFNNPTRAALWAIALQESHINDPILTPSGEPVGVKIAIHWGDASTDPNNPKDYIGRSVDYAARLVDYGRAGQVLVSRAVYVILDDVDLSDAGVAFYEHGVRELRGIGGKPIVELLYGGRKAHPLKGDKGLHAPAAARKITAPADDETLIRPTAGSVIGDYSLDVQIGQGGMGTVFQGRHRTMERQCVIKVINERFLQPGHEELVERFYKEIKLIAKLDHPNIVRAYDASAREEAVHYLVMEYINGVGIENLVGKKRLWQIADACEVIRQAAVGLQYISERGLVHRDIKPSNLMLASRETLPPLVKVLDLGLALLVDDADENRITSVRQRAMGTAYYMPPEQWVTTNVDIRADIYALGGTLYHMLAGKAPYEGSRYTQREAHRSQTLPQLPAEAGCPAELWNVIQKMLAKDRDQRFDSPGEIAGILRDFADGHDLAAAIQKLQQAGDEDSSGSITQRQDKTATKPPEEQPQPQPGQQLFDHTEEIAPPVTAKTQPDIPRTGFSKQKRLLQIFASIGILLIAGGGFAALAPAIYNLIYAEASVETGPKVLEDPAHVAYASGLLLTEPGHNGVWWPNEQLWYFPQARLLLLQQLSTEDFLKIKEVAASKSSGSRKQLNDLLRLQVRKIKGAEFHSLQSKVASAERLSHDLTPAEASAMWQPLISQLLGGSPLSSRLQEPGSLKPHDWHLLAVILAKDSRKQKEADIAFQHALAGYALKGTDPVSHLLATVCHADHGAMYLSYPKPPEEAARHFTRAIENAPAGETGEGARRFIAWAAIARAEIVAKSTDFSGGVRTTVIEQAEVISRQNLAEDDRLHTYLTEVKARYLFEKKADYQGAAQLSLLAAQQRLEASGLLDGLKEPGDTFAQESYFRDVQIGALAKHFNGESDKAVQMIEGLLNNYLNKHGEFSEEGHLKPGDAATWIKMLPNQLGRLADVKFYGTGDLPGARDDLAKAIDYSGPAFKVSRPAHYAFMRFKMSIFCGLGGTSSNTKDNLARFQHADTQYYSKAIAAVKSWHAEIQQINTQVASAGNSSNAAIAAAAKRKRTLEGYLQLNSQFEKIATAAIASGEKTTVQALLEALEEFDPSAQTERDDRQLLLFVCEYLLANANKLEDFEISAVRIKRQFLLYPRGAKPVLEQPFIDNLTKAATAAAAATAAGQTAPPAPAAGDSLENE